MSKSPRSRRDFLRTAASAAMAASFIARAQAAKPRIRIGQIGSAHAHAGGKMDTMRASADFEVVGIVEPDERRRASLATSKTYAGVPVMTEEQLLNAPGLQAVAVETEVKALVPTAARCIAAGKHIHPDKPAGESLPALRRLLSAAHGEYNAGRQTLTFPKGRGRYDGDFEDLAKVILGEKALEFSPAHDCAVHETILRASGLAVE